VSDHLDFWMSFFAEQAPAAAFEVKGEGEMLLIGTEECGDVAGAWRSTG